MIGTLVLIAIVAAVLGGAAAPRSGKVWAYLRTLGFATVTMSLLMAALLLLVHPGWAPLPDDLGNYRGRGAGIVVAAWQFFHSIGPTGTALVLGILGAFVARGVRHQVQLLRSGDYSGADELEKRAEAHKEFLALVEKVTALADASKADSAWIEARPKTYLSREEAEKVVAEMNAANARIAARKKEINRLLARADELRPVIGLPSGKPLAREPVEQRVPSEV